MRGHSAGHSLDRSPVGRVGEQDGGYDQREYQGFRTKLHKPPEEREQAAQPRTHISTAGMTHSLRAASLPPLERGKEQR